MREKVQASAVPYTLFTMGEIWQRHWTEVVHRRSSNTYLYSGESISLDTICTEYR